MALEFLTINDAVDCGSGAKLDSLKTTGLTYSAWIKFTNAGGGNGSSNGVFMQKSAPAFYLNKSGAKTDVIFQHSTSGTLLARETENTVGLSTATLYHLLVTWDGSLTAANIHIYINNSEPSYVLTQNGTGTLNDDSASAQIVGCNSALNSGLIGTLEDFAIYNKVLSATERASLYGNGLPLKGTPLSVARNNLVLFLMLDDFPNGTVPFGAGATIMDESGFGNHGTPTGTRGKTNSLPYPARATSSRIRPSAFAPGLAR